MVSLESRTGRITLTALITERVQPGVVYTTFHHPAIGTNVVTTEFADWATDCPEYKVTAVQVRPANAHSEWHERRRRELTTLRSEEHTSELQSLMRISYAVFCLNKKNTTTPRHNTNN